MEISSKKWVKDLKIAIINENSQKIQELYDELPEFKNSGATLEELQEIEALLASAIEILKENRAKLGKDLNKLNLTRSYQKNMIK